MRPLTQSNAKYLHEKEHRVSKNNIQFHPTNCEHGRSEIWECIAVSSKRGSEIEIYHQLATLMKTLRMAVTTNAMLLKG
jgi:hypothetical protein